MKNNLIQFKLNAPRLVMIDERLVFEFMDYLIFNTQQFTFDPTDTDSQHGMAEFWQKPRAKIIEHLTSQYEVTTSHFTGNNSFWFGDGAKFESDDIYPDRLKNQPSPVFEKVMEQQRLDDIKTQTAIEAITAQPHVFELVCQTLKSLENEQNLEVISFIKQALQKIKAPDNYGYYEINHDVLIRFAGTLAYESRGIYPRDEWFNALNDSIKSDAFIAIDKQHNEWNKQIDDIVLELANKAFKLASVEGVQ